MRTIKLGYQFDFRRIEGGSGMSYTTLQLAQEGAVLTITVNRPEVVNTQSRMMLEEFDHIVS